MDRVDFRPSTYFGIYKHREQENVNKDNTQYLSKSGKLKNPILTASGSIATKLTQHFEFQNYAKISQTDHHKQNPT